jgi:type VI protein secretion system component VasA
MLPWPATQLFFLLKDKFIFLLLRNLNKVKKALNQQFYIWLILEVRKYFYRERKKQKTLTPLLNRLNFFRPKSMKIILL